MNALIIAFFFSYAPAFCDAEPCPPHLVGPFTTKAACMEQELFYRRLRYDVDGCKLMSVSLEMVEEAT